MILKSKNFLIKLSAGLALIALMAGGFLVIGKATVFKKLFKVDYIGGEGVFIEGVARGEAFQILQGKVVEVNPTEETILLERNGARDKVRFMGSYVVLRSVNGEGKGTDSKRSPLSEVKAGDDAVFNEIKKTKSSWEAKKILVTRKETAK